MASPMKLNVQPLRKEGKVCLGKLSGTKTSVAMRHRLSAKALRERSEAEPESDCLDLTEGGAHQAQA